MRGTMVLLHSWHSRALRSTLGHLGSCRNVWPWKFSPWRGDLCAGLPSAERESKRAQEAGCPWISSHRAESSLLLQGWGRTRSILVFLTAAVLSPRKSSRGSTGAHTSESRTSGQHFRTLPRALHTEWVLSVNASQNLDKWGSGQGDNGGLLSGSRM